MMKIRKWYLFSMVIPFLVMVDSYTIKVVPGSFSKIIILYSVLLLAVLFFVSAYTSRKSAEKTQPEVLSSKAPIKSWRWVKLIPGMLSVLVSMVVLVGFVFKSIPRNVGIPILVLLMLISTVFYMLHAYKSR